LNDRDGSIAAGAAATLDRERVRARMVSADLEVAEARFRDHRFAPHRHDTYAIGLTTHGVQRFYYRGADRAAVPGDAFVLHPDEAHDGRPGTDGGYGYRVVYLAPDLVARALPGPVLPFVAEAVSRHPALIRAVAAALRSAEDGPEDLGRTDALARLADALSALSGRPSEPAGRVDVATMLSVRDRLADLAPGRPDAAALAREHGLDRFTLARQFRRLFGVSPQRYVTLRRLALARQAVARGESLAEAALSAGFSDQSHMTRQFGAAYGVSPGAWRDLLV